MAKRKNVVRNVQPIIDTIEKDLSFRPRMSSYVGMSCPGRKAYLRRRAKFAPDLLAEGLSTGIVSSSNTLLHGFFDEDGSTKVDRLVDIQADKFDNIMKDLAAPSADPQSLPGSNPDPSN